MNDVSRHGPGSKVVEHRGHPAGVDRPATTEELSLTVRALDNECRRLAALNAELLAALAEIEQANHPDSLLATACTEAEFSNRLVEIARAAIAKARSAS